MTDTTNGARETGDFAVYQDGLKVAGGWGALDLIRAEAAHYALVYGQDGPVKVRIRKDKSK